MTTAQQTQTPYIALNPFQALGRRPVISATTSDIDGFFSEVGLDFAVERRKIAVQVGDQWVATSKGQATFRPDTGAVLGIVGSKYREITNDDAKNVIRPAVESLGLTPVCGGTRDNGAHCFVLARLPHEVDVTGTGDVINGYALLQWSHDGSSAFTAVATPIRIACQNQLNAATKNGAHILSVRHTASKDDRLKVAAKLITSLTEALIATGETFTHLAKRKLSSREIVAFIESVFPQEGDKLADVVRERRKTVAQLIESGAGAHLASPDGPTAWGAYNAVTEYFDHVRPAEAASVAGRERAQVSAIFGGNHDVKRFALAQARQLVAA